MMREPRRIFNKKTILFSILLGSLIMPRVISAEWKNDSQPYPPELYRMCFDVIDTYHDGKTDLADPDCPKCDDLIDNDFDGLIDHRDPDCPFYGLVSTRVYNNTSIPSYSPSPSIPAGGNIGAGGSIPAGGSIAAGGNIPVGGYTY